ncbi:hypothetical protein predicted by Glimmer/Critica (plasmid) [Sinorhizobium fredii HH103]|uniref:Uncharacterized protein n=1 Tax=Sinorhizobium fredii (strain HH103) TaxID=1117943 RepID=G9AHX2_SINF1|nr:hypothetical protein predicted by Glimmer/Critica [Sinorhizobium fredii HH103]
MRILLFNDAVGLSEKDHRRVPPAGLRDLAPIEADCTVSAGGFGTWLCALPAALSLFPPLRPFAAGLPA